MTDAEITKIADQLGLYDIQDGGRVNGETLLDFARAIIAAQLAAPVAAQTPGDASGFEAWSKREGAMNLMQAPEHRCEDGRYPARYYYAPTESAWRAWANKPAQAAPQGVCK